MGCSNSKPDAEDGLHSVQRQTETTTIKTTVQPQNSESVSASETRIHQQNETPVLHDSPAQSEDDDKIKGTEHMTEQNINNNDNNGNHNESESHNSGTNPGSSSTSNPAAHPGANVGECSGTTVTKVNTLGMQSSLPHSRSGAPSQSKVQPSQKDKESGESYSGLENEAAEMEAAQESFNAAIRLACLLVQPECILQHANEHVQTLVLRRALPSSLSLSTLLHKLSNLQVRPKVTLKSMIVITSCVCIIHATFPSRANMASSKFLQLWGTFCEMDKATDAGQPKGTTPELFWRQFCMPFKIGV